MSRFSTTSRPAGPAAPRRSPGTRLTPPAEEPEAERLDLAYNAPTPESAHPSSYEEPTAARQALAAANQYVPATPHPTPSAHSPRYELDNLTAFIPRDGDKFMNISNGMPKGLEVLPWQQDLNSLTPRSPGCVRRSELVATAPGPLTSHFAAKRARPALKGPMPQSLRFTVALWLG